MSARVCMYVCVCVCVFACVAPSCQRSWTPSIPVSLAANPIHVALSQPPRVSFTPFARSFITRFLECVVERPIVTLASDTRREIADWLLRIEQRSPLATGLVGPFITLARMTRALQIDIHFAPCRTWTGEMTRWISTEIIARPIEIRYGSTTRAILAKVDKSRRRSRIKLSGKIENAGEELFRKVRTGRILNFKHKSDIRILILPGSSEFSRICDSNTRFLPWLSF